MDDGNIIKVYDSALWVSLQGDYVSKQPHLIQKRYSFVCSCLEFPFRI